MEIFIEKQGKSVEMDFLGTAKELLDKIEVNPETVIIVKDGALITEEDTVDDAKRLDLLSVISGG